MFFSLSRILNFKFFISLNFLLFRATCFLKKLMKKLRGTGIKENNIYETLKHIFNSGLLFVKENKKVAKEYLKSQTKTRGSLPGERLVAAKATGSRYKDYNDLLSGPFLHQKLSPSAFKSSHFQSNLSMNASGSGSCKLLFLVCLVVLFTLHKLKELLKVHLM